MGEVTSCNLAWKLLKLQGATVFLCMAFQESTYFLSLWLYSPLDLGRFFSYLIIYTVNGTPWTGDQPVARPLPTYRTTQTQNKSTQTSIPWVGFEPTIPVFERVKTVHAIGRAATMIGSVLVLINTNPVCWPVSGLIFYPRIFHSLWSDNASRTGGFASAVRLLLFQWEKLTVLDE
jgi:hypothetical protein